MGAGWNNFFEVSISIQLTEENYCDTLSPSASARAQSQCGEAQAQDKSLPEARTPGAGDKYPNTQLPPIQEIMSAVSSFHI